MKNIKILGAGISGLTAAINLARAGLEVDVYEKNEDCGMRFHGDMQGLENWSSKENILKSLRRMNIKTSFDHAPFRKVTFTNCQDTKKLHFWQPLFYLVKRGNIKGSLDQSLKAQALEGGGYGSILGHFFDQKKQILLPLARKIPSLQ